MKKRSYHTTPFFSIVDKSSFHKPGWDTVTKSNAAALVAYWKNPPIRKKRKPYSDLFATLKLKTWKNPPIRKDNPPRPLPPGVENIKVKDDDDYD